MEEVQGRVELKYCERCGGLWLRPLRSRSVYCPGCEELMREMPYVGYVRPGARRRKRSEVETVVLHACIGNVASRVTGGEL